MGGDDHLSKTRVHPMKRLPVPRGNVQVEPTSPLGIALRRARVEKQLPQRVIAVALAERCGGEPTNVRVSGFELGKRLPIYEQQIATGKKKVAFRLKPRHPAAAPVPVAAKAKAPKAK